MIPIYKPWITDLEKQYAANAVESTWISSKGKYIQQFEEGFAEFIGAKYAISACNGTAACHLTLLGAGVKEGDTVAVPDLTYIATANAVKYCGAIPVPIDINPETWNIEPRKVTTALDHIFVVPLLGNPIDISNLPHINVIEDACEAIGAKYKDGQYVGSTDNSLCAAFSFFGNKTITTGEGGMVVTNQENIRDQLIHWRGQFQTQTYYHSDIGYNYHMTNVAAAIGCAQLARIHDILEEKNRVYDRYYKSLACNVNVGMQRCNEGVHGKWMFAMKIRPSVKHGVIEALTKRGIETRPMFYPLTTLPPYKKPYTQNRDSKHIHENTIMLPSYPELTNKEIDFICEVIKQNV